MNTITYAYLKYGKGRSNCIFIHPAVSGHNALDTLITQTTSQPYVFEKYKKFKPVSCA